MLELYTASRIAAFRRCPRAHAYRYELGIQTPSGPAAQFGTHLHAALEAWFRAWQAEPDGSTRLASAFAAVDEIDCDDLTRVKLRVLVASYHARYRN